MEDFREMNCCYEKEELMPTVNPSIVGPSIVNFEEKHERLIIFDWDDTLISSSFLDKRELQHPETNEVYHDLEDFEMHALTSLEDEIINLLSQCLLSANVCILTNSQHGWVDLCMSRHFPRLRDSDIMKKIPILHRHPPFEEKYPISEYSSALSIWKRMSLEMFLNLEQYRHIISFGDLIHDRNAVLSAKKHSLASVKTVMIWPSSTPGELFEQIRVVREKLDKLVAIPGTCHYSFVKIVDVDSDFVPFSRFVLYVTKI